MTSQSLLEIDHFPIFGPRHRLHWTWFQSIYFFINCHFGSMGGWMFDVIRAMQLFAKIVCYKMIFFTYNINTAEPYPVQWYSQFPLFPTPIYCHLFCLWSFHLFWDPEFPAFYCFQIPPHTFNLLIILQIEINIKKNISEKFRFSK